jgi:hypothetical protein
MSACNETVENRSHQPRSASRVTMIWPPDRKADPRSVWILVDPKTNQTGAILWKPKQAAP